jgi:hypothetical protein
MDEVKIVDSSQTPSHLKSPKTESLYRTLSIPTQNNFSNPQKPPLDFFRSCQTLFGPAEHCPTALNIVRNLNLSPTDNFLREPYIYIPPLPMALLSWPLRLTAEQVHFLHPQRPNSLSS